MSRRIPGVRCFSTARAQAASAVAKTSSLFALLLLITFCLAGPYADLNRRLDQARNPADQRRFLTAASAPEVVRNIARSPAKQSLQQARSYVAAMAATENPPIDAKAAADARRIKSSPFYRDVQVSQSNWWNKAMTSFWNWLSKLFQGRQAPSAKKLNMPLLGPWVIDFMWGLLGVLLIFLAVLAIRHFNWKVTLTRKSKALLDEDEPERSLDEWLEQASQLESQGRYREAVRCLYLACLLRFDEARIARFDRGQTNWEHLDRIRRSQNLPPGLDFEPATSAFDRIWYGMRTKGKEDVDRFRAWYREITDALKPGARAAA